MQPLQNPPLRYVAASSILAFSFLNSKRFHSAFLYVSFAKIFKLVLNKCFYVRNESNCCSFMFNYEKNLPCWSGSPPPSSCPAPPSSWASCSQNSGASFPSKFIFFFIKHALTYPQVEILGQLPGR